MCVQFFSLMFAMTVSHTLNTDTDRGRNEGSIHLSRLEAKCLYIFLIMITYWCTEAMPIGLTSLIPIIAFPVFGIMPSSEVCPQYFLDSIILFLGGLILAVSIETCNLHRRLALRILMYTGVNPSMLLLGFMLTTSILSMWMNNSATTATMLPIANAILSTLYGDEKTTTMSVHHISAGIEHRSRLATSKIDTPKSLEIDEEMIEEVVRKDNQHIVTGILLSIPYSASIGGIATLTGAVPNLILDGHLKSTFPNCQSLTFGSWLLFAFPFMLLLLFSSWLWISILYGGLHRRLWKKNKNSDRADKMKAVVLNEYRNLGPIQFAEKAVACFFFLFLILLFLRSPKFIVWEPKYNSDAVVSSLIVILLFIFPSRKPTFKWKINSTDTTIENEQLLPLISWKDVQNKVPWSVLFLVGAGFALAKATEESGLSLLIGNHFQSLENVSTGVSVLIVCLVVSVITEFLSNSVTSAIILPILTKLSIRMKINPLYLLVPATVSCSFAFVLPIGTPANAIVYASRELRVKDMVKGGIMLNVLGIILLTIAINTWGQEIFQLSTYPNWAKVSYNNTEFLTSKYLRTSLD